MEGSERLASPPRILLIDDDPARRAATRALVLAAVPRARVDECSAADAARAAPGDGAFHAIIFSPAADQADKLPTLPTSSADQPRATMLLLVPPSLAPRARNALRRHAADAVLVEPLMAPALREALRRCAGVRLPS